MVYKKKTEEEKRKLRWWWWSRYNFQESPNGKLNMTYMAYPIIETERQVEFIRRKNQDWLNRWISLFSSVLIEFCQASCKEQQSRKIGITLDPTLGSSISFYSTNAIALIVGLSYAVLVLIRLHYTVSSIFWLRLEDPRILVILFSLPPYSLSSCEESPELCAKWEGDDEDQVWFLSTPWIVTV